jgi:hypothetical protein
MPTYWHSSEPDPAITEWAALAALDRQTQATINGLLRMAGPTQSFRAEDRHAASNPDPDHLPTGSKTEGMIKIVAPARTPEQPKDLRQ